jgi:hypothetical protein
MAVFWKGQHAHRPKKLIGKGTNTMAQYYEAFFLTKIKIKGIQTY